MAKRDVCPHVVVDAEVAFAADGLCALCMREEIVRMQEEIDDLKGQLAEMTMAAHRA